MPFSPKRLGSIAYSLVMFLIVSVLSGVLIAGLFVPLAGLAGVTTKAAATELDKLPSELATPTPPTRSKVLMANGNVLAYFYDENRIPVKLSAIAPVMRQAQLAIEDHRYYEHGALDFKGTIRAFVRNSAGEATQGGSSITQQYVKMVQVEKCRGNVACINRAKEVKVERKIRELRYAIALEKRLTKDEILERYLNIAYYGEGAYGVEAAARHYFSSHSDELTLGQAAMLAGLVQNPDSNNPVDNPAAASDRRDVVLNRMTELKMITPSQSARAKKVKFNEDKVKPTRNGCVGTQYPFLCDYVRRTLLKTPSLGQTVAERDELIKRGGLTVQTAIDPRTQDIAQKQVSAVVGPTDPVISTMNMIQPGTGLIVAMAQSRPEMGSDRKNGETYWNLAVEPEMGGIQGYQAGSTFKAFTAAAALEKGIPLKKRFNARRTMDFSSRSFQSCTGRKPVYGKWKVSNSTGTNGRMNMYKAAEMSVNTYFVQLALTTGMCRVTKMAERLGVRAGHPINEPEVDLVEQYNDKPAFTLGSVEVSPLSMAEAYATFAARGVHCDPVIVDTIKTREGTELAPLNANCQRVVSADVADGMNKLLSRVVTNGTGKRARTIDGRPQAGKTGTIDSNEAVWYAGYTPKIAGVAMISIDNTRRPFIKQRAGFRRNGVQDYTIPSTNVLLEGTGSGDAGLKIWKPAMEEYLNGVEKTRFVAPPAKIERGKLVRVPSLPFSLAAAQRKLEKEGFTVERRRVFSDSVPAGSFVRWVPRPGTRVGQYSTIYLEISRGRDPEEVREERAEVRKKAAEAKKKAKKKKEEND